MAAPSDTSGKIDKKYWKAAMDIINTLISYKTEDEVEVQEYLKKLEKGIPINLLSKQAIVKMLFSRSYD